MADDPFDPCLNFDLARLSGLPGAHVLRDMFDKIQNVIVLLRPYIDQRTQFNPDYFTSEELTNLQETLQQNLIANMPADERWISVADGTIRHIDDDGNPGEGHIHGLPGSYIEQIWDDLRGHVRKVSRKDLAVAVKNLISTYAVGETRPAVAQSTYEYANTEFCLVTVRIADDWAGTVTNDNNLQCVLPYQQYRDYPNVRTGDVIPVVTDSTGAYDLVHVGPNDAPIGTIRAHFNTNIPGGWGVVGGGRFLVGCANSDINFTTIGDLGGYDDHGFPTNDHDDHITPAHDHDIDGLTANPSYYKVDPGTTKNVLWGVDFDDPITTDTERLITHTHSNTDNRPPYLTVIWIQRMT